MKKRLESFKILKESIDYFKNQGFKVGVWHWSFWIKDFSPFTMITGADGKVSSGFTCPFDNDFIKFAGDFTKELAHLGIDSILLDDDYRFGHLDVANGCMCDKHLTKIREISGEEISREELSKKILVGGKNKCRSA